MQAPLAPVHAASTDLVGKQDAQGAKGPMPGKGQLEFRINPGTLLETLSEGHADLASQVVVTKAAVTQRNGGANLAWGAGP